MLVEHFSGRDPQWPRKAAVPVVVDVDSRVVAREPEPQLTG